MEQQLYKLLNRIVELEKYKEEAQKLLKKSYDAGMGFASKYEELKKENAELKEKIKKQEECIMKECRKKHKEKWSMVNFLYHMNFTMPKQI